MDPPSPTFSLPFHEPHRPDASEAAAATWPRGGDGRPRNNGQPGAVARGTALLPAVDVVESGRGGCVEEAELAGVGGCEARTSSFRDDVEEGTLSMPLSPDRIQEGGIYLCAIKKVCNYT